MAVHTESNLIEDSAEALIREARRRARRRRVRWVAVVAILFGIGASVYAVSRAGPRPAVSRPAGHRPNADVRAFNGHGELAFISRNQLWVLDGDHRTLHPLPVLAGLMPSAPVFSHDGRWLAYVMNRGGNSNEPSELWIARGNGTDAQRVRGVGLNQFIGWSPNADLLAVVAGESRKAPHDSPTTLDLITPTGFVRALFARSTPGPKLRGAIWSAVWSPHGQSLAVSTDDPGEAQILEVPVAARTRASIWMTIPSQERLPRSLGCGPRCGDTEAIVKLAGWWSKWGIGFWVFDSGMTHNADSTSLAVIAHAGATPRAIADTLSDGITDAVAANADGQLAVVKSTTPAGRDYATGKTVERCLPSTLTCTPLPRASTWTGTPPKCEPCRGAPATGPGSAVSLDPTWSPSGTLLAYVKAPAYRAGAGPSLGWFQAHELFVWNTKTSINRRIGTISGSSIPTWSRDGESLLYVSGDGLWLTNATSGKAVEIEDPLYRESAWKQIGSSGLAFYGQVPWSAQFNWFTP